MKETPSSLGHLSNGSNSPSRSRFHRSVSHELAVGLDRSRLLQDAGLTPYPWQSDVLRSRAVRQLLLCGRQTGKSTATAALAAHHAIYSTAALVLLLSPTLRQSQELFRKVLALRARLPYQVRLLRETSLFLEFENGSRIISLPGTEETIRGYAGVTLLVIDEAARVPNELYYSVRPMLAVSAGRLVCLSTPFGKRGWFYDEWVGDGPWERTKITALECPRISTSFLDEERRALGATWFSQEYMCEFAETSYQVFDRDLVKAAFDPNVKPLFPAMGTRQ